MDLMPATTLVDRVLAHAPNCPRPLAERTIMDAAREFCDHTGAHKEPSDKLPGIPGVMLYEFDSPAQELTIARMEKPSHRGTMTRNILELDSTPGTDLVYTTLILKPAINSRKLSTVLVEHYPESITAGALARLLRIPGSAWANVELANMYQMQFSDHLHNARIAVEQPSTVKPRGRKWAC